jgi:hypothetical protein
MGEENTSTIDLVLNIKVLREQVWSYLSPLTLLTLQVINTTWRQNIVLSSGWLWHTIENPTGDWGIGLPVWLKLHVKSFTETGRLQFHNLRARFPMLKEVRCEDRNAIVTDGLFDIPTLKRRFVDTNIYKPELISNLTGVRISSHQDNYNTKILKHFNDSNAIEFQNIRELEIRSSVRQPWISLVFHLLFNLAAQLETLRILKSAAHVGTAKKSIDYTKLFDVSIVSFPVLVTLDVFGVSDFRQLSLERFPALQKLTCRTYKTYLHSLVDSTLSDQRFLVYPILRSLRILKIYGENHQCETELMLGVFLNSLHYCPNLEVLSLENFTLLSSVDIGAEPAEETFQKGREHSSHFLPKLRTLKINYCASSNWDAVLLDIAIRINHQNNDTLRRLHIRATKRDTANTSCLHFFLSKCLLLCNVELRIGNSYWFDTIEILKMQRQLTHLDLQFSYGLESQHVTQLLKATNVDESTPVAKALQHFSVPWDSWTESRYSLWKYLTHPCCLVNGTLSPLHL